MLCLVLRLVTLSWAAEAVKLKTMSRTAHGRGGVVGLGRKIARMEMTSKREMVGAPFLGQKCLTNCPCRCWRVHFINSTQPGMESNTTSLLAPGKMATAHVLAQDSKVFRG